MLEDWEQRAIVDHWRHSPAGFWMLFMLYTGVRRGELMGLRWSDIDLRSNVIHIRRAVKSPNNERIETRGKTRAAIRDIPVFPALRQALIERAADIPLDSEYICVMQDGTPPNTNQFRTMWADRCGWLSVTTGRKFDIKPHDLRHTFCSILYESTVSVKTAAAWLGHSDIQTTMNIYTHLSSSLEARDIAAAQNTFNNKFGDGGELPWANTPDL
jgi:integrase